MSLSVTLPDPVGLQFTQWGELVTEALAAYAVESPTTEDNWRGWACALFYVPELVAENIPTPEGFDNWVDWACQFVGSLR